MHPAGGRGWAPGRGSAATAACLAALTAGCSAGDATSTAPTPADPSANLPQASEPVDLDPADFTTTIDNTYWPMEPRTRWVYTESEGDGAELRVAVTVTTVTKPVANGITARVVRDTVTEAGAVVEDTYDWYAQDSSGTVWYVGEDTAEFEDGKVTSREGSFEAGVDGAMAGVIMPGDPAVGMAYRQEYYRGEAEDNGEVLSVDEMADVPAGHFDQALLTKDTLTIDPDVLEYKLYAPGVGPVLVVGISGGGGREALIETTRVPARVARAAGRTPLGSPYG